MTPEIQLLPAILGWIENKVLAILECGNLPKKET